jgi:uncharacterized protein (TIGR00251 family)
VIRDSAGGILIDVHVIPRARRTAIAGMRGDALLVRLAAPPVDGAANSLLIQWLADRLQVPRQAVRIAHGEKDRRKLVAVDGVSARDARHRLGTA